MTSTSKRLLVAVLAVVLTLSVATLGITAFAVTTTDTIEYPFAKGDNAFKYAPTWKGQTAVSDTDSYQFFQPKFAETDLSSATYIAIQVKAVKGTFSFTVGAISSGNGRYGTYVDKTSAAKLVAPDGTITDLNILYASLTLTQGTEGMLLIPMANMSWVGGAAADAKTLDKMASVFFETNAKYNYNFELTVGEVGYYVGEPGQEDATYTTLLDLSKGEKKDSYYVAASTMEFPSETKDVNAVPETMEYPLLKVIKPLTMR